MSKLILCAKCGEHHVVGEACHATPTRAVSTIALATLLGLTACKEDKQLAPETSALYGVDVVDTAYLDGDGDGFTPEDGDCDDDNPEVHPEATETPGDGIDSNCDGEDDT